MLYDMLCIVENVCANLRTHLWKGGFLVPISYKKLFALLDEKGWTTYKIRKEKLIGQGTLTALKNGTGGLDSKTIARLCKILNCQPGDLMEYVPDKEE